MKRHQLDHLLGSPAKVAVLRVLSTTSTELTGRETARLGGVSVPQAINALNELVRHQIVIRRQAGRAGLYAINDSVSLVKKGVLPLFRLESSLLETALARLAGDLGTSILSLTLFGSRARRDERADSDVDLLVVPRKSNSDLHRRILERTLALSAEMGLHFSPLVLTLDECRKASGQKKNLIMEISRYGKTYFGKPLKEMIRVPNS